MQYFRLSLMFVEYRIAVQNVYEYYLVKLHCTGFMCVTRHNVSEVIVPTQPAKFNQVMHTFRRRALGQKTL